MSSERESRPTRRRKSPTTSWAEMNAEIVCLQSLFPIWWIGRTDRRLTWFERNGGRGNKGRHIYFPQTKALGVIRDPLGFIPNYHWLQMAPLGERVEKTTAI